MERRLPRGVFLVVDVVPFLLFDLPVRYTLHHETFGRLQRLFLLLRQPSSL
jgi:hypothetical protein